MKRRTAFTALVGSLVGMAAMGSLVVVAGSAEAVSPVPPTVTAKPNNVMVDTDTTVFGKNFNPGQTVHLIECSATSWVDPNVPCTTDNGVTVTANKHGSFKVPFKAEACPAPTPGISERCYIGVPVIGLDNGHLQPYTRIIVTFP